MAHTHEFDCKACGMHLESREELDRHNREKHAGATQSGQSNVGASSRSPSDQARS
ncbi:MAG: hypothetical protein ACJ796_02640 [Gemmatimonadaceae bacterium]